MAKLLLLTLMMLSLHAETLRTQIAQLLIVGIDPKEAGPESLFVKELRKEGLGGVILFRKNIQNPAQLKRLTGLLHKSTEIPLWIAIDQEGGAVQRLSTKNGFFDTPGASEIAKLPPQKAAEAYRKMAGMLKEEGIDIDFAPVLDLARNPKNGVIVKAGRSYAKEAETAVRYATILLDALEKEGVAGCVKHFPGHGSSAGDSHKGFTDVTRSWDPVELKPFAELIAKKRVKMLMSAHIYNRRLDPNYPATLSCKILTGLLREKWGYEGVIVSDDMQMGAISKNYGIEEAIMLALNAGVDMLLFANQIDRPIGPKALIDTIERLVEEGKIKRARIKEAYKRVMKLKGVANE